MHVGSTHSGEMSQDSLLEPTHQKPVMAKALDPAARKTKRVYNTLSASATGLELGISVILGILFGMWLDTKAGTSPWLMLLFMVFGLIAGFRGILRAARRVDKASSEEDRG